MKGKSGHEQSKMKLMLSTGYEVEIDLQKPQPDLEHLARALMGEIIFPKLEKTLKSAKRRKNNPSWVAGLHAAKDEILELVHDMETADLRLLTIAVMWAYLVREFDRIEMRGVAKN